MTQTITSDTTLAQLLVVKTALGVTHLTLNQTMINGQWLFSAHGVTSLGDAAVGNGDDEAEAIEACFERLRAKIGRRLAKPVSPSR